MNDGLSGLQNFRVGLRDLDLSRRLQFESICSRCLELPGPALRQARDIAAISNGEWFLVNAYVDIRIEAAPLPRDMALEIAHQMRFGLQSQRGSGRKRLALETRFNLAGVRQANPEFADRLELGYVRTLALPIRISATADERFFDRLPPGLDDLPLHDLEDEAPTMAELLGSAEPDLLSTYSSAADTEVWGTHETDPTGLVFTGNYIRRLQSQMTACLTGGLVRGSDWQVRRAQLLFKSPFRAYDRYRVSGGLLDWSDQAGSVCGSIHAVRDGHADPRPAVLARFQLAAAARGGA